MYKAVIFDFDGTLIDSVPQYVKAFENALSFYGFEKEAKQHDIAKLLGYNSLTIISKILEGKDNKVIKKVHKKFVEITGSDYFYKSIGLKEGVYEILRFFKAKKIKMFIISGSSKRNLEYFLERFKLKNYFDEIIDGEQGFKGKPHPDAIFYIMNKHRLSRKEVVYVGDGILDYEMAKNAGIKFIGVRGAVIDEKEAINNKFGLIYSIDELRRYFLKKIVAVVGMAGSGKTSAVNILSEKFGKDAIIYFGEITFEVMKKEGFKSEKEAREWLREQYGMEAYAILNKEKIKNVLEKKDVVIIDGLYSWEEYLYLKEYFRKDAEVLLLSLVAPRNLRYYRLLHRDVRPLDKEQSYLRDLSEIKNLNKALPIVMADFYILNFTDMRVLENSIETWYYLFL